MRCLITPTLKKLQLHGSLSLNDAIDISTAAMLTGGAGKAMEEVFGGSGAAE